MGEKRKRRITDMRIRCLKQLYLSVPCVRLIRELQIDRKAKKLKRTSSKSFPPPLRVRGVSRFVPLGADPPSTSSRPSDARHRPSTSASSSSPASSPRSRPSDARHRPTSRDSSSSSTMSHRYLPSTMTSPPPRSTSRLSLSSGSHSDRRSRLVSYEEHIRNQQRKKKRALERGGALPVLSPSSDELCLGDSSEDEVPRVSTPLVSLSADPARTLSPIRPIVLRRGVASGRYSIEKENSQNTSNGGSPVVSPKIRSSPPGHQSESSNPQRFLSSGTKQLVRILEDRNPPPSYEPTIQQCKVRLADVRFKQREIPYPVDPVICGMLRDRLQLSLERRLMALFGADPEPKRRQEKKPAKSVFAPVEKTIVVHGVECQVVSVEPTSESKRRKIEIPAASVVVPAEKTILVHGVECQVLRAEGSDRPQVTVDTPEVVPIQKIVRPVSWYTKGSTAVETITRPPPVVPAKVKPAAIHNKRPSHTSGDVIAKKPRSDLTSNVLGNLSNKHVKDVHTSAGSSGGKLKSSHRRVSQSSRHSSTDSRASNNSHRKSVEGRSDRSSHRKSLDSDKSAKSDSPAATPSASSTVEASVELAPTATALSSWTSCSWTPTNNIYKNTPALKSINHPASTSSGAKERTPKSIDNKSSRRKSNEGNPASTSPAHSAFSKTSTASKSSEKPKLLTTEQQSSTPPAHSAIGKASKSSEKPKSSTTEQQSSNPPAHSAIGKASTASKSSEKPKSSTAEQQSSTPPAHSAIGKASTASKSSEKPKSSTTEQQSSTPPAHSAIGKASTASKSSEKPKSSTAEQQSSTHPAHSAISKASPASKSSEKPKSSTTEQQSSTHPAHSAIGKASPASKSSEKPKSSTTEQQSSTPPAHSAIGKASPASKSSEKPKSSTAEQQSSTPPAHSAIGKASTASKSSEKPKSSTTEQQSSTHPAHSAIGKASPASKSSEKPKSSTTEQQSSTPPAHSAIGKASPASKSSEKPKSSTAEQQSSTPPAHSAIGKASTASKSSEKPKSSTTEQQSSTPPAHSAIGKASTASKSSEKPKSSTNEQHSSTPPAHSAIGKASPASKSSEKPKSSTTEQQSSTPPAHSAIGKASTASKSSEKPKSSTNEQHSSTPPAHSAIGKASPASKSSEKPKSSTTEQQFSTPLSPSEALKKLQKTITHQSSIKALNSSTSIEARPSVTEYKSRRSSTEISVMSSSNHHDASKRTSSSHGKKKPVQVSTDTPTIPESFTTLVASNWLDILKTEDSYNDVDTNNPLNAELQGHHRLQGPSSSSMKTVPGSTDDLTPVAGSEPTALPPVDLPRCIPSGEGVASSSSSSAEKTLPVPAVPSTPVTPRAQISTGRILTPAQELARRRAAPPPAFIPLVRKVKVETDKAKTPVKSPSVAVMMKTPELHSNTPAFVPLSTVPRSNKKPAVHALTTAVEKAPVPIALPTCRNPTPDIIKAIEIPKLPLPLNPAADFPTPVTTSVPADGTDSSRPYNLSMIADGGSLLLKVNDLSGPYVIGITAPHRDDNSALNSVMATTMGKVVNEATSALRDIRTPPVFKILPAMRPASTYSKPPQAAAKPPPVVNVLPAAKETSPRAQSTRVVNILPAAKETSPRAQSTHVVNILPAAKETSPRAQSTHVETLPDAEVMPSTKQASPRAPTVPTPEPKKFGSIRVRSLESMMISPLTSEIQPTGNQPPVPSPADQVTSPVQAPLEPSKPDPQNGMQSKRGHDVHRQSDVPIAPPDTVSVDSLQTLTRDIRLPSSEPEESLNNLINTRTSFLPTPSVVSGLQTKPSNQQARPSANPPGIIQARPAVAYALPPPVTIHSRPAATPLGTIQARPAETPPGTIQARPAAPFTLPPPVTFIVTRPVQAPPQFLQQQMYYQPPQMYPLQSLPYQQMYYPHANSYSQYGPNQNTGYQFSKQFHYHLNNPPSSVTYQPYHNQGLAQSIRPSIPHPPPPLPASILPQPQKQVTTAAPPSTVIAPPPLIRVPSCVRFSEEAQSCSIERVQNTMAPHNVANPAPPSSVSAALDLVSDFRIPGTDSDPPASAIINNTTEKSDLPNQNEIEMNQIESLEHLSAACDSILDELAKEKSPVVPPRRFSESSVQPTSTDIVRPEKSASVGSSVSSTDSLINIVEQCIKLNPKGLELLCMDFVKQHAANDSTDDSPKSRVPASTITSFKSDDVHKPGLDTSVASYKPVLAPQIFVKDELSAVCKKQPVLPPIIMRRSSEDEVAANATYNVVNRCPLIASKQHAFGVREAQKRRRGEPLGLPMYGLPSLGESEIEEEDKLVIDE